MPTIPSASGSRVVRALHKAGFQTVRQTGSHVILCHPDRQSLVTIPVHGSRDIPKGTLRNILKQANITGDELRELL